MDRQTHLPEGASPMAERKPEPAPVLVSVGRSTRTLEEFLRFLRAHGVTQLVDVRTIPKSRHNP